MSHYWLGCLQRSKDRKHCILEWRAGAGWSSQLSSSATPIDHTASPFRVSKKCVSPPSVKLTTLFRGKCDGGCVTVITSIKDLRITVANERQSQCRHEHVRYYKERNYIIVCLVGINSHSWKVLVWDHGIHAIIMWQMIGFQSFYQDIQGQMHQKAKSFQQSKIK